MTIFFSLFFLIFFNWSDIVTPQRTVFLIYPDKTMRKHKIRQGEKFFKIGKQKYVIDTHYIYFKNKPILFYKSDTPTPIDFNELKLKGISTDELNKVFESSGKALHVLSQDTMQESIMFILLILMFITLAITGYGVWG